MADGVAVSEERTKVPKGYEDELSGYGPVLFDGWCGEPIAWGFAIQRYLGKERFDELGKFGELECVQMGKWVLVTRWLTGKEAHAKYGSTKNLEEGPRGGFRSVTYGETKFISKHMRPKWM